MAHKTAAISGTYGAPRELARTTEPIRYFESGRPFGLGTKRLSVSGSNTEADSVFQNGPRVQAPNQDLADSELKRDAGFKVSQSAVHLKPKQGRSRLSSQTSSGSRKTCQKSAMIPGGYEGSPGLSQTQSGFPYFETHLEFEAGIRGSLVSEPNEEAASEYGKRAGSGTSGSAGRFGSFDRPSPFAVQMRGFLISTLKLEPGSKFEIGCLFRARIQTSPIWATKHGVDSKFRNGLPVQTRNEGLPGLGAKREAVCKVSIRRARSERESSRSRFRRRTLVRARGFASKTVALTGTCGGDRKLSRTVGAFRYFTSEPAFRARTEASLVSPSNGSGGQ